MAYTSGYWKPAAALLAACLMGLAPAAAQELVPPSPSEGSGLRGGASFVEGSTSRDPSVAPLPDGDAAPDGDATYVFDGSPDPLSAEHYNPWHCDPAPAETSGTWLDRGYWYSQVEAVVMVRQWNRQALTLAGDGVPNIGFLPGAGPTFGIINFSNSNRALTLGRSTPGREGSVRLTLGRFLYRDGANRDHNAEFTVLGGGEFGQNSEIFVDDATDPLDLVENITPPAPGIVVLPGVDLGSVVTLTGAESASVQYDSRFNSFELNYTVKTRLPNDRVELLPNGQWVRRANAGLTYQFLGGVRYIDLTENLDWTANNIDNPVALIVSETGQYLVRTSNDNFGLQGGFGASYRSGRFSIESLAKVGILANDVKSRSSLTFTDPTTGVTRTDIGFSNSNRTDTLSLLTEFSLVGRVHLRPNLSWRAGYNLLLLSRVALAPHQLDFEPDDSTVSATGDVFYHGISTGLDFYW